MLPNRLDCIRIAPILAILFLLPFASFADSVVVFNEVMYHPVASQGEADGEWVELHNQMDVKVDLSGWSLQGGIDFSFP